MKHFSISLLFTFLIAGIISNIYTQEQFEITLEKFADGIHHYELFAEDLDYPRLDNDDFKGLAENLIALQNEVLLINQ